MRQGQPPFLQSPYLNPGDTFGIVSPSWFGGEAFIPRARHGIDHLVSLGFKVKVAPHAFNNAGHVSDTAIHRARDINTMFADDEIDAILCTIGGTHSIDTLRHLDWNIIKANPKPFIGYSDITTLNLALYAQTGLSTINGPYLLSDWAEYPAMPLVSQDWILKLLMSPLAPGDVPLPSEWTNEFLDWTTGADRSRARNYQPNAWHVLRHGIAEGPLIGGCIECLCPLLGSPYRPDFRGAILFLETAGDLHSPFAADELMAALEVSGVLDDIAGLLFAKTAAFLPEHQIAFRQLLMERVAHYKFPVIAEMDFGHHTPNIAMPIGPRARIKTDPLQITILESPVHI